MRSEFPRTLIMYGWQRQESMPYLTFFLALFLRKAGDLLSLFPVAFPLVYTITNKTSISTWCLWYKNLGNFYGPKAKLFHLQDTIISILLLPSLAWHTCTWKNTYIIQWKYTFLQFLSIPLPKIYKTISYFKNPLISMIFIHQNSFGSCDLDFWPMTLTFNKHYPVNMI